MKRYIIGKIFAAMVMTVFMTYASECFARTLAEFFKASLPGTQTSQQGEPAKSIPQDDRAVKTKDDSQTAPTARQQLADDGFNACLAKVRKAVNAKNRKALSVLMAEKRQWGMDNSVGKNDISSLNDDMLTSIGNALESKAEVIKDNGKCRKPGTCYKIEGSSAGIYFIKMHGKWKKSEMLLGRTDL